MSIEDLEIMVKSFAAVFKIQGSNLPEHLRGVRGCTILVHVGNYYEDWENTRTFSNLESAFEHMMDCSFKLKATHFFRGVECKDNLLEMCFCKSRLRYKDSGDGSGDSSDLIKILEELPLDYRNPAMANVDPYNVRKIFNEVNLLFKDFDKNDSEPVKALKNAFQIGFHNFQRQLAKAIDVFVTKDVSENCISEELNEFMNSEYNPEKINSILRIFRSTPLVTYYSAPKRGVHGVNALLGYVCPSWTGGCPSNYQRWACKLCSKLLRFDPSTLEVNCQCGSLALKNCGFKCNHTRHGILPASSELLLWKQPRSEINCLLLGESGSGKSNLLNSLVNYLLYESLDDAAQKEPVFLVSTAYTNYHKDGGHETRRFGIDVNEQLVDGRTHTLSFRNYIIPLQGDKFIRFIDSPGFDPEKKVTDGYLKAFLEVVSRHHDVHALCWVIDSNQRKLSQGFVSAFKSMTSLLTEAQLKSFVFVFTHFVEEQINYKLVNQVKKIHGELPDPVFKVNNEAFPHLVSRLAGQTIKDFHLPRIRHNWIESSRLCVELCNWLSTMEPQSFSRKPVKKDLNYNPLEEVVFETEPLKLACMLQLRMSGLSLRLPCNVKREKDQSSNMGRD